MPCRSTFFRAAAALVFVGATSPAFSQPLGDMYVRLDLGWGGATNANIHNRDQPVVNPLATVSGIKGPACQELAKELAQIIGQELSFAPTAEFYECEEHRDVDIEDQSRT